MAYTRKFYTADTHFGHPLMVSEGHRPFASTLEMDQFLIDQWNSVVAPDDMIFHLGDFCCGDRDPVRIKRIFDKLKGRKYLILGNHDVRSDGSIHPSVANLGWEAPPTAMMETRDEGERVILCHYSLRTWAASHHGSWHFYGHSHGALPTYGRSRDVGVDCRDTAFTPRTFKQLVAGMDGEIAA